MMDALAPPQGEMPAPPQGMAEGGYLPPYASGGLADLDIPDGMFDEPSNGGYANGGLIAFREGGDTSYGYNYNDPTANLALQNQLFGVPQTKYADEAEQDFVLRGGADYKKGQRKKDLGQLMAEAGFGMMAGTSPFALQNIGAAMMPAISNATERAKERRGEERDIRKGLMDIEAGRNTAAAARASRALDMQAIGIRGREGEIDRNLKVSEGAQDRKLRRDLSGAEIAASKDVAKLRQNPSDMETALLIMQGGTPDQKKALEAWLKLKQKYGGQGVPNLLGIDQEEGNSNAEVVNFSQLK